MGLQIAVDAVRRIGLRIVRHGAALCGLLFLLCIATPAQTARKKNAPPPPDKMPLATAEEAAKLEAVITTDAGVIRFEFFPDKALRHTQQFIKLARAGYYDGSAFHSAVVRGLIQGGDPLLKDPQTPRARWGQGGLNQIADEFSDIKHDRGIVSTVRIPGKADSGGAQFFICLSPQPQLDGQYSAFGRVTEGLDVATQISLAPVDDNRMMQTPARILNVKIEPKKTEPFKDATIDEMRREVLLHTSLGDITLALDPDLAPEHCRNFLKLVETRWYDHTVFHRIIPGFVVQGGMGTTRTSGPTHPADRWVRKLKGEFSQTRKHLRGALSMARADDPNSAETSFFIVLAPAPNLDGKYTIFGKVVDGFEVLDRMEQAPRNGEGPQQRIELIEAVIKP
ncbi:MAG TPA: peptidylprolyl isomerase [Blastocatellia bacterium]|nr:peptidylprolyl isomerase [Blastocatellia bacterium]